MNIYKAWLLTFRVVALDPSLIDLVYSRWQSFAMVVLLLWRSPIAAPKYPRSYLDNNICTSFLRSFCEIVNDYFVPRKPIPILWFSFSSSQGKTTSLSPLQKKNACWRPLDTFEEGCFTSKWLNLYYGILWKSLVMPSVQPYSIWVAFGSSCPKTVAFNVEHVVNAHILHSFKVVHGINSARATGRKEVLIFMHVCLF